MFQGVSALSAEQHRMQQETLPDEGVSEKTVEPLLLLETCCDKSLPEGCIWIQLKRLLKAVGTPKNTK